MNSRSTVRFCERIMYWPRERTSLSLFFRCIINARLWGKCEMNRSIIFYMARLVVTNKWLENPAPVKRLLGISIIVVRFHWCRSILYLWISPLQTVVSASSQKINALYSNIILEFLWKAINKLLFTLARWSHGTENNQQRPFLFSSDQREVSPA